jgi:small subunit ribosomal protein S9
MKAVCEFGSRKRARAQVKLKPGKGRIEVNSRPAQSYFGRADLFKLIQLPLTLTQTEGEFDLSCQVSGGGLSAQAGAIKLGLARALANYDPELRKPLKKAGLLKRDPREKERMKYGLAKRRKRFQWTKR